MRLAAAGLALAMLSPALSGAIPVEAPSTWIVGLALGAHVSPGERRWDSTVVRVDDDLAFAVVRTLDATRFRAHAAEDREVSFVSPETAFAAAWFPNDPRFWDQRNLFAIEAPRAWDFAPLAASAALCVVDTGLRGTHEEFAGRVAGFVDLVAGREEPYDDHGHGTLVAGVAAAASDNGVGVAGVAGTARVYAAKALDASGRGTDAAVASAIGWCARQPEPRMVVVLSLGDEEGKESPVLARAVERAAAAGILLVAATGNRGCDGCVSIPARYPDVLAVGCATLSLKRCGFSPRGPEVDLVAPGENALGPWSGQDDHYLHRTGTSVSAPSVAGAAILAWSAAPFLSASDVRRALECSARDLGAPGRDADFGNGLLDAREAVLAAMAGACPGGGAPDAPPVARWSADVRGAVVALDASPSFDPEGRPLTFRFDLGDGTVWWGPRVAHAYERPGTYTVRLVVGDGRSEVNEARTIAVRPAAPGEPTFHASVEDLAATLVVPPALSGWEATWDFGDGSAARGALVVHNYEAPGSYGVLLVATRGDERVERWDVLFVPNRPAVRDVV
ncbi:MAG TPA: S8 family serine peptidase [Candidatus Thermoplasmatota archaeon]|nr:S8 family serine peptidase [Candidatus Thermoplasmatota archaeon]